VGRVTQAALRRQRVHGAASGWGVEVRSRMMPGTHPRARILRDLWYRIAEYQAVTGADGRFRMA